MIFTEIIYTQIFKLFLSSIIGIIIGIERTKRGKSAGVATFSITCVTSCFLTLISAYGFTGADPSRLISNIITAIGFVAGGVIFTIEQNSKKKVTGITTGAILFCVSSLGIGIGLGMYVSSLVVVIIIELNINIAIVLKKHYKKQKELEFKKEEEDEDSDI